MLIYQSNKEFIEVLKKLKSWCKSKSVILHTDVFKLGFLKIKLSYTMDEDPNYLRLYKALKDDWDTKNDKDFAKQILAHAPGKLFIYSISNWHSFFTKRCFGPGDGSFPYMPEIIRYFYTVGYALLYRPLLAIMLVVSFIILTPIHKLLVYSS